MAKVVIQVRDPLALNEHLNLTLMKRYPFSLIVFILMLVTMMIGSAESVELSDDEVLTCGDYQYTLLEDGTAQIKHYNGKEETIQISRETYEQIRAAENVYWTGMEAVFLKSEAEGNLLNLRNGEIILSGVESISRCGNETVAVTQNGIWLVNAECGLELFPFSMPEENQDNHLMIADDWIAGSNKLYYFFWNVKTRCGGVKRQKMYNLANPYSEGARMMPVDTWTDPTTGQSIILFVANDISEVYGESGELLNRLEWKPTVCTVAVNAHCRPITNGRLFGYRKDGCAVIRDVFTGKDIKVFSPGWAWRIWDGECHIFEDGTALLTEQERGENMIVDMDGKELIRTSRYISDRFAYRFYQWEDLKNSSKNESYYIWDQNACEIYRVIETYTNDELKTTKTRVEPGEDIPGTTYIPEIADGRAAGKYDILMPDFEFEYDYHNSCMNIRKQSGELLGGQPWSEIWYMTGLDGIDYNHEGFFVRNGFLPVKSMENKWGVLAVDGHMVLPAEYDRILGADTGTDYEYCIGFVAWKDGEINLFDLNGRPVFCVAE